MSIFCYCCSGKLICHLNLETYFGSGTFSRILFGGGEMISCSVFSMVLQELSGHMLEFLQRYSKHVIFLFFILSFIPTFQEFIFQFNLPNVM